jgi:predicted dithiol-disulfide oxidoreductase (DUF899 family)
MGLFLSIKKPPDRRQAMEHLRYPNESAEYRAARNALLNDEIALRAQIETVAAKRRALPPGGKVSEDYVFERTGKNATPEKVKMSELFGSHDTLILYSFMYGPERELQSLVSTAGNNYDADYFGDTSKFSKGMRAQHRVLEGENWDETIFNVFRKSDGEIRHFWGSEMSFAPTVPNQHHRAGDLVDPLGVLLDMTPEGRGDFFPKVNYD